MIGLYILAVVTSLVIIVIVVWTVWLYNIGPRKSGPRNFVDLPVGTKFRFGPEKLSGVYVVLDNGGQGGVLEEGWGKVQLLSDYNRNTSVNIYFLATTEVGLFLT